jgi:peptidoglycan/xylan/chitin deacetylase (PgdA/CDA1 family)
MSKGTVFLMYHEVQASGRELCDESSGYRRYVVSEEEFRNHLEVVKQKGYVGWNASQSLASLESRVTGQPGVCFTFDDGCASDLHVAVPLLHACHFNATFYVTVDHLGRRGYLSRSELRELSDLGCEIGSHSMTHRLLNDLGPEDIKHELSDSKRELEEIVGKAINHFSCPGGRVNSLITELATEAGYQSVATSQLGTNAPDANRFSLKRVAIRRGLKLKTFARICSGKGQILMKSGDSILSTGKRFLGNERYDKVRASILSLVDPAASSDR